MSERDPIWIHAQDQSLAAIAEIAVHLGTYRRSLQGQGFSTEETERLVFQLAGLFWEKALFHGDSD